jgi:cobalt-precorrin-5B (C1)-methyltransferase
LGQTHASRGEVDLNLLAQWTQDLTGSPALAAAITQANTARGALELLLAAGAQPVVDRLGKEMLRSLRSFADRPVELEALIFSSEGALLWLGEI